MTPNSGRGSGPPAAIPGSYLEREGGPSYPFGEACSMPSLKRPLDSWPGASGRRCIPRLKRGRRQKRVTRRASPWLKRPRRWRRQGRRRMPLAKPGSVWSGVAGVSFDAVIGLVLSSYQRLRAPRVRSTSDVFAWPPGARLVWLSRIR